MKEFFDRQLRAFAPMFRPPFDGLWILALLYFFWCFLVHPQGEILRGNLPDPDDYMYLDQSLDWLKGQGWYDHIQHRLDPPGGGMIHFSRIPQIPMAFLTLLFELFGLKAYGAATLMAVIEPLFLFAGFFFAIRWVAECVMPKDWSGVTAYVTIFSVGILSMYVPGHIDHHGLEELLMAITLGCALRLMRRPDDLKWGLAAGLVLALALMVALEVLPWIIMMSAWIGLWAIVNGGRAARAGHTFGLALYIGSVIFLLISKRPSEFVIPDVAAYSVVYVLFTGSIAAVFTAIALAGSRHIALRFILGAAVAVVTGTAFLHNFPSLLGGPWGGVNPALAKLILENVNEAQPLFELQHGWFRALVASLWALIALGAVAHFLRRAKPKEFWLWGLIAVLLTTAFLLTLFYQYRFIGALGLFGIVPLAVMLQRGWLRIGKTLDGRRKVFAEIGLLLLVGPLPTVLIPAIVDGRSLNNGVLLFPVHNGLDPCDMSGLEHVLRAPQLYRGKPRIIMNTMGIGPELLFRTPDMVVSAPYHEDVAGNLDAVRFFSATDPKAAEAIARRHHAELVVTCKMVPGTYSDLSKIRAALPDAAVAAADASKPSPPMILKLITGQQLPSWLARVQSPLLGNYVVYEITPSSHARRSTKLQ